jgi:hypothetical protein
MSVLTIELLAQPAANFGDLKFTLSYS